MTNSEILPPPTAVVGRQDDNPIIYADVAKLVDALP
jgi:hypothetical protein